VRRVLVQGPSSPASFLLRGGFGEVPQARWTPWSSLLLEKHLVLHSESRQDLELKFASLGVGTEIDDRLLTSLVE
jgi:hypothetical protein